MHLTLDMLVRVTSKVKIPTNALGQAPSYLDGLVDNVKESKGLVIFVHGSGSGPRSSRNQYLSQRLNNDGLSTLLVDLLTRSEQDADRKTERILRKLPGVTLNKFNIDLLANRLVTITRWSLENKEMKEQTLGYFGASTGSAATLVAASDQDINQNIAAIVSRSGRPDLAIQSLPIVKTPTLFIVGEKDSKKIIQRNEDALDKIGSDKKKLIIVPQATHLFEEKGTLEQVGKLASGWFRCYFQIWKHRK